MLSTPKFSIVVVNHKTLELTRACLESIRTCSVSSSYELIVVDNDSQDESLTYLRNQKDIRLIERSSGLSYSQKDHGESLDIGLRHARGEYLVAIDSDVLILKNEWLEQLYEILIKENAVMVGPAFYRSFIHPCMLMVRRDILIKYKLSFKSKNYFHWYYDTAEVITKALNKRGYRIIKLYAWSADCKSSRAFPIDSNNISKWVSKWWLSVKKNGAYIGNLAFHAFYGTRILNSDCDGSLSIIQNRIIDPEKIKMGALDFETRYELLKDTRRATLKIKGKIIFVFLAVRWFLLNSISKCFWLISKTFFFKGNKKNSYKKNAEGKFHVVLVSRHYPRHTGYGGVATYNYCLSHALVNLGHRVTVIASRWSLDVPIVEFQKGINIHRLFVKHRPWMHRIPFFGKYMRALNQVIYSFRIANKIHFLHGQDKIDFIEFADIEAEGFFYLLSESEVPTIVRCHTPAFVLKDYSLRNEMPYDTYFTTIMEKYAIRHANILTAPSKDTAKVISGKCGIPIQNIAVIPNGIELVEYKTRSKKNETPGREITTLYVGRFDRRKGIEILAQAIPDILSKSKIKFILIGDDGLDSNGFSWRKKLEDYFDKKGIRKNVTLLGRVDQNTLLDYYQSADIAVVPSLLYESFSYTCAQAMASGLPVIASRIGGIPETLDDGVNGILVQPGDVRELSAAIFRLVKHPELRQKMGHAGREKAQHFFDSHQTAKKSVALAQAFINKKILSA